MLQFVFLTNLIEETTQEEYIPLDIIPEINTDMGKVEIRL